MISVLVNLEQSSEVILLLIEHFLEFYAESLEFARDIREYFCLVCRHIFVDLFNLTFELTASGVHSLLKCHLDVKKVTLQRNDQVAKFVLH